MIMFSKEYTIKREDNVGEYDDSGKYVSGEYTPLTIDADCQPITGIELESLNIGRDNLGKIKIYTDEELVIAEVGTDGTNLSNGDQILFKDNYYEVIGKLPYEGDLINHNKYVGELRITEES